MRLSQIVDDNDKRAVVVTARGESRLVKGVRTTLDLALEAITEGAPLRKIIADRGIGKPVNLAAALKEKRVLLPLDHDDPAHVLVTGTGLTHLGSAEGRDKMHRTLAQAESAALTDSMKMFKLGLDGGKPAPGATGVQPEWFYKGDGSTLAQPGGDLVSPGFALDGGEEPEIVGVYVVDPTGTPVRVGFALGNEFSDHVTERQNYLYLAHSKLRPSSVGPELLVGEPPPDVQGASRIRRGKEIVWEKPFISGEENMSHAIANLEQHHFKYALFRRPGDVHVHFFGTATLSFSDGIKTEKGDVFEIDAEPFGLPLRNRLALGKAAKVKLRRCRDRRRVDVALTTPASIEDRGGQRSAAVTHDRAGARGSGRAAAGQAPFNGKFERPFRRASSRYRRRANRAR